MSEQIDSGIFCSIPVEHNSQGGCTLIYDERREAVLLYLLQRKGEIFTALKIAKACSLPMDGTQVLVRKLIKEINHLFAYNSLPKAVISTPRGFYYTDKLSDIKESIERHEVRIKGILRTINDEKIILARMVYQEVK
jgi:hypothetical protein